jgi:mRNA interferase MazF
MNRGEIWTLRDEGYSSKARPVVIVQANPEKLFNSVILCLFTTFESSHIPTRVHIDPTETNGLKKDSFVMTEKLITIGKKELGEKIGVLTGDQMHRISRQLANLLEIHKEDIGDIE